MKKMRLVIKMIYRSEMQKDVWKDQVWMLWTSNDHM